MAEQLGVTSPIKIRRWYHSKIFWIGLVIALKAVVGRLTTPGWTWDVHHALDMADGLLGIGVSLIRLSMPDLFTGLAIFDKK